MQTGPFAKIYLSEPYQDRRGPFKHTLVHSDALVSQQKHNMRTLHSRSHTGTQAHGHNEMDQRRANRTDASADRRHKVAPIRVQREAAEHAARETDRVLELHRRRAVRPLRHRRRIAIAATATATAAIATSAARS